MRYHLGIRGRLAVAISLAALIPVAFAIYFARSLVQQTAERFFVPELRPNLERGLSAYGNWARSVKATMRAQAGTIALDPELWAASKRDDAVAMERRLRWSLEAYPSLRSAALQRHDGEVLAQAHRQRPFDPNTEHELRVIRELGRHAVAGADGADVDGAEQPLTGAGTTSAEPPGRPLLLELRFTTAKAPFDEFARLGEFIEAYSTLEERRRVDERTYVLAFAALLGITIIIAMGAGALFSRSVVRRISKLAGATRRVADGDLSVRVEEEPPDEVGELGKAFNRMLVEVESSRNRIEYLSRLASWQEMARRLAHEIKNPLTPIQLAVQELHQRLSDLPSEQRRLLDVVLEVVETEVSALRRLVLEFSQFARLPQSRPTPCDLREFLEDLKQEAELGLAQFEVPEVGAPRLELRIEPPSAAAVIPLDRQMMRGVLVNLIRNSIQAAIGREAVRVQVGVERSARGYRLYVDDDGPGLPRSERTRVFEPYVTTKDEGTGLGLAIAKKVVMDHLGSIDILDGPLGGARLCIELPANVAEASS